jgi:hypothetical protein
MDRRVGGWVGAVRQAVFALVGGISETATYVRHRQVHDGDVIFEVVTGFAGEESHFVPHGHAVRLRVKTP